MLSKSFILVLCYYSTIPIISTTSVDPKSVRATADDAQAAFQEFNSFAGEILSTKYNETSAQLAEAHQKIDTMQQEALDTLTRKIIDVKSKIAEITGNLVALNISSDGNCDYSANQLDGFETTATARILRCTQLSRGVISHIFSETWDDFIKEQGDYMGCVARSLGHCIGYATDDRCFDHIVSFIQSRRPNLQNALERIDLNFKNKLASFKMPCQKMIDFEISTYPEYVLPSISQCAETNIRNTRPYTCADPVI